VLNTAASSVGTFTSQVGKLSQYIITLATSLVQSRLELDYANSLLHSTSAANIRKLQCAQNSLSRVVLSGHHREVNTCQLAWAFVISTGSHSISVLISSWP